MEWMHLEPITCVTMRTSGRPSAGHRHPTTISRASARKPPVAKTNCENCRNIIMKTSMGDATENEKYLEFREYLNIDEDASTVTKLIRPTAFFAKVVETQLAAFNRIWQHYWCSTKILNKITNECIDLTNKIHLEWLDQNNACYNHRLQALKYMISVKLYSRTRYNNRANKISSASYKKIKNFSNK
ncbi:hypothetical protein ACFW04_012589 [Cataglyphis niger]